MQRTEVEVRGDDIAGLVIRGMLDGRELVDGVFIRHDDHARGVLTRGALDAHAARHKAVHFHGGGSVPLFLTPLFDVTVRRFFGKGADGTGFVNLPSAKELLDVFMRSVLVDAGEVQVNIGNLIAVEAEEDFKRDVIAVMLQIRALQ